MLCFFNLLPIPPLDGSQVVRSLIGMSFETYHQIARYGFLILILAINMPFVRDTLGAVTQKSFNIIAGWFGFQ
ncbi:MAG: site-2 protease family protein, partial [Terrimicrobiaceae bacterium]